MLISLVTGTYNRLDHLKAMIDSARLAMPAGDYEIVIVDGGSTDGTLDYCRAQPDVALIEHGGLRGAIRAFTDGGNAARGTYTLLANDDVVFPKREAIFRAIRHLEESSTCGAVAFGDNRPQRGYNGTGYKVNNQAVRVDGRLSQRPYAQVGLFRTALGKAIGWWGADDPCMSSAAAGTYGGDNWLSAKLWEMGYSVDAVKGVYCADNVVRDGLREYNQGLEDLKPGGYYRCYPEGPTYPGPVKVKPGDPLMRVLYLPIFESGRNGEIQRRTKTGLRKALQTVGHVWEVDYLNTPINLAEMVAAWQPDLILSQLHGPTFTAEQIKQARAQAPGAVWVNWNGDAHHHGLTARPVIDMLRAVDLQLVVNAAVLPVYAQEGIKADYWQIGYEEHPPVDTSAYDVVFLGNAYSPERLEIERVVRGMKGVKAGFFGQGWAKSDGENLYDFAAGEGIYRHCKIALADCWRPAENVGFTSNRLIQALGAGAFVLQQDIPELERYTGLQESTHYAGWQSAADLPGKIKTWLKAAGQREAIGMAGRAFVQKHFTFTALVSDLLDRLIPQYMTEAAHDSA